MYAPARFELVRVTKCVFRTGVRMRNILYIPHRRSDAHRNGNSKFLFERLAQKFRVIDGGLILVIQRIDVFDEHASPRAHFHRRIEAVPAVLFNDSERFFHHFRNAQNDRETRFSAHGKFHGVFIYAERRTLPKQNTL